MLLTWKPQVRVLLGSPHDPEAQLDERERAKLEDASASLAEVTLWNRSLKVKQSSLKRWTKGSNPFGFTYSRASDSRRVSCFGHRTLGKFNSCTLDQMGK